MSSFWFSLILVVHILIGISVIVFVLLQHGKGADVGAAFGSGASGSLFGASGSANFLSRTTAILATGFFLTSLSLTFIAGRTGASTPRSVMDGVQSQAQSAPAVASSAPVAASAPDDIPK